jgi:hypothetical protein
LIGEVLRDIVGEAAREFLAALIEFASRLIVNVESSHQADGEDNGERYQAKPLAQGFQAESPAQRSFGISLAKE